MVWLWISVSVIGEDEPHFLHTLSTRQTQISITIPNKLTDQTTAQQRRTTWHHQWMYAMNVPTHDMQSLCQVTDPPISPVISKPRVYVYARVWEIRSTTHTKSLSGWIGSDFSLLYSIYTIKEKGMLWIKEFWHCHSLTIVLFFIIIVSWSIGPWFEGDRLYDFIMNIGHDCFSIVILYLLAGKFREINKEDD